MFYKKLANGKTLKVDKFPLYVPKLIPDAEKKLFNNSILKSFTSSFDFWSTDRKTDDT